MKINSIEDIVGWDLCTGCGICFDICKTNSIRLINLESKGIRPIVDVRSCSKCNDCLQVCPGYKVDCTELLNGSKQDVNIGPHIEVWEGYSSNEEIRYKSASGGVLTALSLFCIENKYADSVVHAGGDSEKPLINTTYISKTRNELINRAASRYSPASPCNRLSLQDGNTESSVFIGKPCDSAAVYSAIGINRDLKKNIKLVLNFFCAGAPKITATKKILKKNGINKNDLRILRYRGYGWPGMMRAVTDVVGKVFLASYEDSWGQLNKYRSKRCLLCPDGLGHMSDITCGDSWHNYTKEPGKSIIIIRTQKGMEIFKRALDNKYITANKINKNEVIKAQENLLNKKYQIFARLLVNRLMQIPVTKYKGFSLFRCWINNSPQIMIKSILGTFYRIITRKQHRKVVLIK